MNRKFFAIMLSLVMCFALAGLCLAGCASKTVEGPAGPAGPVGPAGPQGSAGQNGVDGITPDFKVEGGVLYVSYDEGTTWSELGSIAGVDGITPEFKVEGDIVYVSYDKGANWTEVGSIGSDAVVCEHDYMDPIVLKAHTVDADGNIVPGAAIRFCKECGHVDHVLDNEHVYGNEKQVIPATCTTPETTAYVCTICGHLDDAEETGDALDHLWTDLYTVVEDGKTICMDGGYKYQYCTRCDEYALNYQEAMGHEVAEWFVDSNHVPTATKAGRVYGVCDECGTELEAILPALTSSKYNTSVAVNDEEAVCGVDRAIETTYTLYVGFDFEEGVVLSNTAVDESYFELTAAVVSEEVEFHSLNGVEVTPYEEDYNGLKGKLVFAVGTEGVTELEGFYATCAKAGQGYFICEDCGESVPVTTTVEHTYEKIEQVTVPAKCETTGRGLVYCSVCSTNTTDLKEVIIPATGHTYVFHLNAEEKTLYITCEDCNYNAPGRDEHGNQKYYTNVNILEEVKSTCLTNGHVTFEYVDPATGLTETETLELALAAHTLNGQPVDPNKVEYAWNHPGITELEGFYSHCANGGTKGQGYYVCEGECGKSYKVTTVRVHNIPVVDVPAGCETWGKGKCTHCGEEGEIIEPLGHAWAIEIAANTKPGQNTTGEARLYCSRGDKCDAAVAPEYTVVLPELSSDLYDDYVAIFRPEHACQAPGTDTYFILANDLRLINANIGHIDFADLVFEVVIEIDAAPHYLKGYGEVPYGTVINIDEVKGITELEGMYASCMQNGEGYFFCETCGGSAPVKTTRNHRDSTETITLEPNCTTTGLKDVTCSVPGCGGKKDVVIPATGHDYEWEITETNRPTTLSGGRIVLTCQNEDCNGVYDVRSYPLYSIGTEDADGNPVYAEKINVATSCMAPGKATYTGVLKDTFVDGDVTVEIDITYSFDQEIPQLQHYPEEEDFKTWEVTKTERFFRVDANTGDVMTDDAGNALYVEREVHYTQYGYLCDECDKLYVVSSVGIYDGLAVVIYDANNGIDFNRLLQAEGQTYVLDGEFVDEDVEGAVLCDVVVIAGVDVTTLELGYRIISATPVVEDDAE